MGKRDKSTMSKLNQENLRVYDPMKDKRINAMIDVPHDVRSKQKVIVIANVQHKEECEQLGVPFRDIDDLSKDAKDRTLVKKWARKWDIIFVSSNINKKV